MNIFQKIIATAIFTFGLSTMVNAAYNESGGLVVMEMENTDSSLQKWVKKTAISGYTGSGYLEFTGNNPKSGSPNSPLEFTFKINNAGLYYLHLHCAKENLVIDGENRTDIANDAYVRVDGNYGAGPNAGNSHGMDAPLSMLKSDTKFFGGSNKKFDWASGNRLDPGGHTNKRVAVYDFKAGETYKLVVHGRSQFFKVNRIVFRHKDISTSVAQNLSTPESGTSDVVVGRASFNKNKDILIAQFDSKPDPDDIHAQAALGSLLTHPDHSDIKYFAVAGAIGKQGGKYIHSEDLFELAFGPENTGWTDADKNWNASVTRIANKVKPILEAGGKAWIQEAGQSDITADWVKKLIDSGVAESVIKKNVILVQHADWNENATTPADLAYVKEKVTYQTIDNGNDPWDDYSRKADRGPNTPDYATGNTTLLSAAKAASNPNSHTRALWTLADKILTDLGLTETKGNVKNGKVDYSDVTETWWILEIGDLADTTEKFWARYVVNSTGGSTNKAPSVSFKTPVNGANFDEPASITQVEVNASDSDGTISNVKLYINNSLVRQENVLPYQWSSSKDAKLANLAAGSYQLKAIATDNDGATKTSIITISVSGDTGLPTGQDSSDIGNPAFSTLATFDNGSYLINASGTDIWGKSDSFGFIHEVASGDVEVTAQVESISNTNSWAKAGVMIRESLDANSKHAMTVITPAKGASFQRRTSIGQNSFHTTIAGVKAPEYVRVLRLGNAFTGYYSSGNNVWFPLDTVNISMSANTQVGLAVTSHNNLQETEAQISDYSVKKPSNNLSVVRFILINASTNEDIREIYHNETIDLSSDGSNLSIRAEISGSAGSVVFDIDGTDSQVETFAPYCIKGDKAGDYISWTPALGSQTIMATPFSEARGAGAPGSSLAIVINVVE